MALARALRALPEGWSGPVYSDSKITLDRFFAGAKNKNIPVHWIETVHKLVLPRLGKLEPVRLDGHPTVVELVRGVGKRGGPVSSFNCWCDETCQKLADAHKAQAARRAQALLVSGLINESEDQRWQVQSGEHAAAAAGARAVRRILR